MYVYIYIYIYVYISRVRWRCGCPRATRRLCLMFCLTMPVSWLTIPTHVILGTLCHEHVIVEYIITYMMYIDHV